MTNKEVVYLSLGSNIGDRKFYLDKAIEEIKKLEGVELIEVSPFYVTSPWGKKDQRRFLNCAVKVETALSPWVLLERFKNIERELGKDIKERWAERTIDIDIIFYGKKVIFEKKLIIPHPRFRFRKFVLIPLCDISKDFVDPESQKRIEVLLDIVDDDSDVELVD